MSSLTTREGDTSDEKGGELEGRWIVGGLPKRLVWRRKGLRIFLLYHISAEEGHPLFPGKREDGGV